MVEDFVSEIFGIAESFGNYEITLIQCDAEIQKVDTISTDSPIDLSGGFDLFGRGGLISGHPSNTRWRESDPTMSLCYT